MTTSGFAQDTPPQQGRERQPQRRDGRDYVHRDDLNLVEYRRLREAGKTLSEVVKIPEGLPDDWLDRAECVVVFPDLKKIAIGFGASYARGVMSCRTGDHFRGAWSAPSMAALEGFSFGWQIGLKETDLVLLILNKKGSSALLRGSTIRLGGNASVAGGPKGRDITASTDVTMRSEILSYSRSRGLFAGVSLEGTTLRVDRDANERMYGQRVDAEDIIKEGEVRRVPSAANDMLYVLNRESPRNLSGGREEAAKREQEELAKDADAEEKDKATGPLGAIAGGAAAAGGAVAGALGFEGDTEPGTVEVQRLEDSGVVVREILATPDTIPQRVLDNAECLVVVPKARNISRTDSGSKSSGTMTCRTGDDFTGRWSAPSMVSLEVDSVGLLADGKQKDLIILVVDETGAEELVSGETLKLGDETPVMAGPMAPDTAGIAAATGAAQQAAAIAKGDSEKKAALPEFLSYSRSDGLFSGVSLKGKLRVDREANKRLYGRSVATQEIIREGQLAHFPPEGRDLVSVLNQKSPENKSPAISARREP
ncbi:MAG: lipid-binding SYLF domain-containing protein [Candidatus Acidiferrales bacterium]